MKKKYSIKEYNFIFKNKDIKKDLISKNKYLKKYF